MAKHRVLTTDAEIDAAMENARKGKPLPAAKAVVYAKSSNVLIITLQTGRRLAIPREELQGLENASARQLAAVEMVGGGVGLHWEELDADLYVPALVNGIYGSERWMAELGRRGGSVKSASKSAAARVNGRKGGRPKKQIAA